MVLWHLILLLLFAATIRVHGQFDSNGFLSIDCGYEGNSYNDTETNLTYVADRKFIDRGKPHIFNNRNGAKEYQTLRYFPYDYSFDTYVFRPCYTIPSLTVESKYLIRATFYYGNYDNLNMRPVFNIYLGPDFWCQVNISTTEISHCETIIEASAHYLLVCLEPYYGYKPFISSLHLRQLNNSMYDQYVSSTQSLISVWRYNLGAGDRHLVRYPDDKYDRWWTNYSSNSWAEISTNFTVAPDTDLETPSLVMQTAATTLTTQEHLVMNWDSNTIMTSSNYCVILFFAEIKDTSKTGRRVFNIYGQGSMISSNQPVIPTLLSSQHIDFNYTDVLSYNLSLEATPSSTLPPLLNAIELYIIAPVRAARTSDKDFAAIYGIKEYYKIFKDWNGDPCNPYRWEAVTCSPDSNNINILRISSMNLRNYGLKGSLSDHFGDLTALTDLRLEYNDLYGSIPSSLSQLADLGNLYLSHNNLSGILPESLGQLTSLQSLDLSYNRFSGSIPKSLDYASLAFLDITKTNISTVLPPGLQRKRRDGSLQFRYGDTNPTPSPSHKKNSIIAISVVVPLMVIAVATVTAFWLKRKKHIRFIASQPNESYDPNRQFSYNDIKRITNNFENNIGTGGYGTVYFGLLEDGVQVAVKVRSHSSKQGIKEFSAEARNLTRVHHKNLVSLMGYCVDKNCMAIVYEYMQEGNLQDKLEDDEMPLSWIQRLRIVYESALGLEYLHQACNPPLIHRDVKTSNILLNSNLEAKVADFGLSRAFNNEASCRVLTTVVGTIGYLDPEYYMTNQLSAKSDVFSFGIVLLEIITGRAPIIPGEGANLEEWVHQKVSEGDIQSIVDPKMQRKYDINSVWKVTNLACKCTEHTSSERPTMTEVVAELKDSLNLEISEAELHNGGTDKYVTDVSHDSDEVAFIGAMSVSGHVVR